jgi:PilZ domain
MKAQTERQGDRISIAMPIQVFGTEITGQDFVEMTQTRLLFRDGAAIELTHRLAPMQQITVRNLAMGTEAAARVIGEVSGRPNARVYGIALLEPDLKFWNVNFPGACESEAPGSQCWMECGGCAGRELATLSLLERDVFQANRSLTRPCKWCEGDTVWQLASHEASGDKRSSAEPPKMTRVQPAAEPAKSRNARKHSRVQMKMTACVHEPGYGTEEIVQVENISRGGLSFLSSSGYSLNSMIEVAAPYMKGGDNVFSFARVKRIEVLPDKKLKRYGVSYVKDSSG